MSKNPDYERYRKQCEEAGRVDFYEHLILEGNNPGFAAMLAMQRPAGTKGTERAFLEGQQHWADKISHDCATELHRQAKNAGISTQGKKYIGGLGRPTDKMAWVSTQDDVSAALKADEQGGGEEAPEGGSDSSSTMSKDDMAKSLGM